MKRILFLDDEMSLLQGLRRCLRPMRNVWDLHFFETGAEALEALRGGGFDAVVTDLRMPKMNGIEFLTHVRARYPQVLRLTLSGSEQKLVIEAAGLAHQCLLKPCDTDMLIGTLTYALGFHERLTRMRAALGEGNHYACGPVDARAVLNVLADGLRAEWKDVRVSTELKQTPPVICVREDLLVTALNLASNAHFAVCEVADDRPRAVTLSTIDHQGALELRVTDNGVGISEVNRPRLFQPFFTTRKVGQGTGQGLASSKGIVVDKYGGTLSYETEVGKGSTFRVRWPFNPEVLFP